MGEARLLQDRFLEQAGIRPNSMAIDEGEVSLTYDEIEKKSRQCALALLELDVQKQDKVALFTDNGIDACVAMLACLRVGVVYVPFNPAFPAERMIGMIENARIKHLVVTDDYRERAVELFDSCAWPSLQMLLLSSLQSVDPSSLEKHADKCLACGGDDEWDGELPEINMNEDDPAYVLYTSGSTGDPKGVVMTHANANSFLSWSVRYFELSEADRICGHARIGFDLSVFDIYAAFWAGACYCPIRQSSDLAFPGSFLSKMRISVWFSVPSSIDLMDKSGQLKSVSLSEHLRVAILAGEALLPQQVETWMEAYPEIPMYNGYGPTEAAVLCTCHAVTRDDLSSDESSIPIGYPCDDTKIYLIDEQGREITDASMGRIAIAGAHLSPGYLNNDTLTSEKFFILKNSDGEEQRVYDTGDLGTRGQRDLLYYHGRIDDQVQIGGYRVELGEIDQAMKSNPACHEFAAVYLEEKATLIAAVSLKEGVEPKQAKKELVAYAKKALPWYMVPKKFVVYAELPKNPNGKIDRKNIKMEQS